MKAKKKRGRAGDDESNCGLAYHTDRNDKPVDSEVLVVLHMTIKTMNGHGGQGIQCKGGEDSVEISVVP